MIVPQQVQESMGGQVEEFPPERMAKLPGLGQGAGDTDHHITEELRFLAGLGFSRLLQGKGKDVRGGVDPR